jgi:hypothetical protein
MWVVLVAFVLSLFFRTPPLRAKSALQEAADDRAELEAQRAADEMGALIEPGTSRTEELAVVGAGGVPQTRREAREAREAAERADGGSDSA